MKPKVPLFTSCEEANIVMKKYIYIVFMFVYIYKISNYTASAFELW